ncbi:unnamed protein product, partial [Nesidiocoris tenuis]
MSSRMLSYSLLKGRSVLLFCCFSPHIGEDFDCLNCGESFLPATRSWKNNGDKSSDSSNQTQIAGNETLLVNELNNSAEYNSTSDLKSLTASTFLSGVSFSPDKRSCSGRVLPPPRKESDFPLSTSLDAGRSMWTYKALTSSILHIPKMKALFEYQVDFDFDLDYEFEFDFEFDQEFEFLSHCEFDFDLDYEFEFDFEFDYEFEFLFHCEFDFDFDYDFDFEFDYQFDFLFHCEFDFDFDYEFEFDFDYEFKFLFDFEMDYEFLFHCEFHFDLDYEFEFTSNMSSSFCFIMSLTSSLTMSSVFCFIAVGTIIVVPTSYGWFTPQQTISRFRAWFQTGTSPDVICGDEFILLFQLEDQNLFSPLWTTLVHLKVLLVRNVRPGTVSSDEKHIDGILSSFVLHEVGSRRHIRAGLLKHKNRRHFTRATTLHALATCSTY